MKNPFTNFRTVVRLDHNRALVPLLKSMPNLGSVLEIGSKDARYNKHFQCTSYETLDNDSTWTPTYLQSAEEPFGFEKYDAILCFQVLEHIGQPDLAVFNSLQALKEGGLFIASVPFQFPNHSSHDYHRWTRQGAELLVKQFGEVQIIPYGNFVTSSWMLFNWSNYLGIFNWLIHKMFWWTHPASPDGFVIIARKK